MLSKTHHQRMALTKPHVLIQQQQPLESFDSRYDVETGIYKMHQHIIEAGSFESIKGNLLKENHQRIKRGITSPVSPIQKMSVGKSVKEDRLMFPIPTTIQAELQQSTEKKKAFGIICKAGRTLASFN